VAEKACEQREQMTQRMSLALDGLLSPREQQHLEQHVQECAVCQTEWQMMQQVSDLFDRSPQVGPPLGFAIRVERRLEEKERQRRRLFGGLAVLSGSLSLAGLTVTTAVLMVVGWLLWLRRGAAESAPPGSGAVSQIASGMGVLGKGASLFLVDILVRYGPPLVFVIGLVLVVLVGMWLWLFVKRPGSTHHNGYA